MSEHKEIREALEKSTPGPWKIFRDKSTGETQIGTAYDHPQLKGPNSVVSHAYGINGEFVYIQVYDADLIANAPEWLRQLLDENERLDKRMIENHRRAVANAVIIDELRDVNQTQAKYNEELQHRIADFVREVADLKQRSEAQAKEIERLNETVKISNNLKEGIKEQRYTAIDSAKALKKVNAKLQDDKAAAMEALRKAESFISRIMGFYGQGLSVFNWHQNGDGEPWDNFFDENMDGDEIEVIHSTLQRIGGESQ